MDNNEPQIKISDPYLESVKVVQEQIGEIKNSFNWVMTFIIGILLLGFLTLLFMVAGLVLDTWRFNSSVYKENKTSGLSSSIIQNNFDQQQTILNRLNKIDASIKKINIPQVINP